MFYNELRIIRYTLNMINAYDKCFHVITQLTSWRANEKLKRRNRNNSNQIRINSLTFHKNSITV